MKKIPDDFDIFLDAFRGAISDEGAAAEYFFDDEPLERILYGEGNQGPSSANLFWPARKYVQEIITACREGKVTDLISAASELVGNDFIISAEMCSGIVQAIGILSPYYPNPVMEHDLTPLRPLIDKIWAIALEKKDVNLQDNAGTPVFRWYEHHGMYEEARQVLGRLIEISRERVNRRDEAIYLNNLGFEYLLEKRWKEAIPYFEEAARIFKEIDVTFEGLNARANYWLCRFELDDLDDIDSVETEVKEIMKHFKGTGRWFERKPLILLAKIEERRGNIEKAISLVEKAIESSKNSNTRYPEMDGEYLEQLKRKSG
jgi:tetratricopeptide (TPR) repeat protein